MHVITLHTPDYFPGKIALPVVRAYCVRWGYILHAYDHSLSRQFPPAWSKIIALQRIMSTANTGDWLTWIDADVLILRPAVPLDKFSSKDHNLIFSADMNGLCSGFFLIRACPEMRGFLLVLWENYTSEWPWEQAAMKLALSSAVEVERQVAYIPESVVQNPISEFNSEAFAMHYWARSFGCVDVANAMFSAIREGWNERVFSMATQKHERTISLDSTEHQELSREILP